MKYCIDFSQKSEILNEIDEINLEYDKRQEVFLDFLLEHQEQRINICICEHRWDEIGEFITTNQIELIHDIMVKYPELKLYIRFPFMHNVLNEVIEYCKENNMPFYFKYYITTWDELYGYIDYGVSDVIIAEALAFSIQDVSKITHDRNVTVRVIPDIAQSSWSDSPSITKFFIRPEDIPAYESYVDVMELYGDGIRTNVTYCVYAKDKQWYGDLRELILDLKEPLDSRGVTKIFGHTRRNCHKKCVSGGKCTICSHIKELSEMFIENDIIIK